MATAIAGPPGSDASRALRHSPERIQGIVNELRGRLAISNTVHVSLVPDNQFILSVEPIDGQDGAFRLSIEDGFIDELTDDELEAAVAHELGHVWIFTHHPYLQTEALANQIARRLVTRDSLVRVYEKVWRIKGTKGDLSRFLGE